MTKDESWEPLVDLRQTGPKQLTLTVTQALTAPVGELLQAALYPEHDTQLMDLTLTRTGNVHTGVFDLAQIGPASRTGKVLAISSDGNASYESAEPLGLGDGESIAWQSMPGTPPLPPGASIRGQSYRLDAYPASLVANGDVLMRFEEPGGGLTAAALTDAAQSRPAIHFWNGDTWRRLETELTTTVDAPDNVRLAKSPSQGVGVYAVLVNQPATQLYLPMIRR
jgi:hypothetical protein